MRKFFIFLAALIGIALAAVLILGAIEPTDIVVSRSILIKAPKDSVFEQIVQFRKWPNWSPWNQLDSTMKMSYIGTDGETGSGYHWVGDEDKVGEGEMKNMAMNGTQMEYELHILKPMQMDATGMLVVKDTTKENVKVTWNLKKHTSFPLNAMGMFINMDKLLGKDFENGLGSMKKYVEGRVPPPLDIKVMDYPAHIFVAVRKTVSQMDMDKFFKENLVKLTKMAAGKINGPAFGLFYTWDTVNKNSDMAVAYPVSDSTLDDEDAAYIYISPSKAVMAVQKGGYSKSMEVHNTLRKYLASKGKTQSLAIEEYIIGPFQEPDSNKWITNVYYLVK